MSGIQIAGVGLSTIDILARLGDMPTWDTANFLSDLRVDGGGPVGTGLTAAARLGAKTGYVGVFGSDLLGEIKLSQFKRDGVDVSRAICRPGPESNVVLVYVHEVTGERVFSFARNQIEMQALDPAELDRDYLTSADYLLIDGYQHEAAHIAAEWMHEAGKKVMLDARKAEKVVDQHDVLDELVRVTDILICGSGFSQSVTGKADVWDACEAALDLGPEIVVQTEGDQGCCTVTREERFHTPAFKVPVVDTTGAGDVFHGAYLVGLLKGWNLRRTAVFASAVSAMKCMVLGGRAGIPTYEAVMKFLNERGHDFS